MRLPPWHPHPDVWLLVALLEGGYLWALSRLRPVPREVPGSDALAEPAASRRQIVTFTLGVAAIWIASDWPVHDLAERYLLSVHMIQHMLISLVAPPLLLIGLPSWLLRRIVSPRPINWLVRTLARPLLALIIFNTVIAVTHAPPVAQTMLEHHPWHFVGHAALFCSAALMWWPVVSPLPEMPTLSYPGRMVYLFLQSLLPTIPASFLTFGTTPLYPFYAHVPRIWGISVMTDQLIAGLIMKLVGGAILWSIIAVVFFRWFRLEQKGWDALAWHGVEREVRSGMRSQRPPEVSRR
jgi:putative membrane protein